MQILKNHISPETAYVVDDYPYGFRLRCKIRYWLEYKDGKGFRFISQTTNPKRGDIWNKPKASTYARFGACMYLDEQGHVTWSGLSEYSNGADCTKFIEQFGKGVPEAGQEILKRWTASKVAYDAARAEKEAKGENIPLSVGLLEARAAFIKPISE
jgi:hypothetical protein